MNLHNMKQPSETLLVTLVQANLHWEDKDANLSMFDKMIRSAESKMEVVVLPEMFNTGFSMEPKKLAERMDGPSVAWMKKIAADLKIILVGSVIIEEDRKYYNRLVWMLPTGETGYYDKRHLFAYGGEDDQFSRGNKRLIASVKGWKLNLQVCYDLRFPVWARQSVPLHPLPDGGFERETNDDNAQPEYDALIYVANWPEKRKHAWITLLQAWAIENQCYAVGVNRVGTDGNGILYSGDSMVVDPMGEIVETEAHEEKLLTYTLTLQKLTNVRSKLPFLKDADPFIIGS
jgi:predicted amidohydrolase